MSQKRKKGVYWSLHIILWIFALIFGSIASSNYQWFPGWIALLFPVGGSLFLATLYTPFMRHFSRKTSPQPVHSYEQSYQQGYQSIQQNPVRYPEEGAAYPQQHEQPQANYPQGMMQQ